MLKFGASKSRVKGSLGPQASLIHYCCYTYLVYSGKKPPLAGRKNISISELYRNQITVNQNCANKWTTLSVLKREENHFNKKVN